MGPGRAPQENFGIFECMKSDLRPFAQQVYNVELFTADECLQILQVDWALTKLKLCVPHTLATSIHNDAHINGYAISLEAGDLSSPHPLPPSKLPVRVDNVYTCGFKMSQNNTYYILKPHVYIWQTNQAANRQREQ